MPQPLYGDLPFRLGVVLLAWEIAVHTWQVPSYLMPSPSAVAARLAGDPVFFAREGLVTLGEAQPLLT